MPFDTREKKVASYTDAEFSIEIDKSDLDELLRLQKSKFDIGVKGIKIRLMFTAKGSTDAYVLNWEVR